VKAELKDAVRNALRQADTYDRKVFQSMGVKTIWVNSFDEMPGVIDQNRAAPEKTSALTLADACVRLQAGADAAIVRSSVLP
jgi:hypothetical protein